MPVSAAATALSSMVQGFTPPTGGLKRTPPSTDLAQTESASKTHGAWAQKNKLSELQAHFREKLLKQNNLTDSALGKMTEGQRAAVEADLRKAVTEHVGAAVRSAAETGQNQPGKGVVVDVKA